jgi:hypothetical protein
MPKFHIHSEEWDRKYASVLRSRSKLSWTGKYSINLISTLESHRQGFFFNFKLPYALSWSSYIFASTNLTPYNFFDLIQHFGLIQYRSSHEIIFSASWNTISYSTLSWNTISYSHFVLKHNFIFYPFLKHNFIFSFRLETQFHILISPETIFAASWNTISHATLPTSFQHFLCLTDS